MGDKHGRILLYAPLTEMLPMPRRVHAAHHEHVEIPGPAGRLEGILGLPRDAEPIHQIAVICHPHPQHGGTMNNKVVNYLAKSFNEMGFATVRFNFRGVGASEGQYGHGEGETDDALAAVEWMKHRFPNSALWLGGFSFGSYTALRASNQLEDVAGLITVAPAVNLFDFRTLSLPSCPWLVVQGDQDEIVPCVDVLAWANELVQRPSMIRMKGAGHFFHGRMNDLKTTLVHFIRQYQRQD